MTCGHRVGRGPSSSPNRDEIVYLSKKNIYRESPES